MRYRLGYADGRGLTLPTQALEGLSRAFDCDVATIAYRLLGEARYCLLSA
jgi:hypothetical protein